MKSASLFVIKTLKKKSVWNGRTFLKPKAFESPILYIFENQYFIFTVRSIFIKTKRNVYVFNLFQIYRTLYWAILLKEIRVFTVVSLLSFEYRRFILSEWIFINVSFVDLFLYKEVVFITNSIKIIIYKTRIIYSWNCK